MKRLLALLMLLAAPALAAPVDQAGWNGRKQTVALPNGTRLAYVEMGDPAGPPLLLLHGYTDTSRSWSLVAPYLPTHRLLMPDQRGHGGSDKPECCYAPSDFAHDARLFLDAMGVERAAVAGHSLGSMVAQTLAAEHPERVSKLILIGSTSLAPVKRGDWLWTEVNGLADPIEPGSRFMREWSPANAPTPVDPGFAAAAMTEILAVPRHVWRGVLRELVDVPVGRLAPDISSPTLILSGGKDPIFPPHHHRALTKALPHAQAHVFAALGHNLNWERPEEVAAAMAEFLAASGDSPARRARHGARR
ncbi:MAG TPA: alpha/beta hydrolase [Allosphingosinicella sp.]|nr:alpha/beta hydrolase [Allosphingosinicella sp.]